MKKILLIMLVLIGKVEAQTIGCFVMQGQYPNCSTLNIQCGTFDSDNQAAFGYSVAELCSRKNSADSIAASAGQSALTNLNLYNACVSNAAANEANRQEWIAYGNAQAALAQRLRRACGRPCKKIK